MTDIYQRIKQDHDQARKLMGELKDCEDKDRLTSLFDEFKIDMWAHHKVEEAVLYESLATKRATKSESFEAVNEHHIANGLIEELDSMAIGSAEWRSKLGVLFEVIEHHMEEEEEETFEEARAVVDEKTAKSMAAEFDRRKAQVTKALAPLEYDL